MITLRECQSVINRKFAEFSLPECPANLYDPIRYMLELEAKRLRPSLVLLGCNVFSDDIQKAIFPALAIELFHNFTLMHDDIMDHSALRRNSPTVHARWNQNIAILSGDAMLIKAYEMLSLGPAIYLHKIMPVFNKTAIQVCEGQQYDMDYEHSLSVTIENYIRMVEYKTAVLIAASLKIGALVGDAGEAESEDLYKFGRNIGIAFQLQDDLLDVFADQEIFGKTIGNDIVANKKTILLVEALNQSSGIIRKKLLRWIKKKKFNSHEKILAVKSIYEELNLEQSTNDRIRHYYEKALENLNILKIDASRKSQLLDFSTYLLNRKK